MRALLIVASTFALAGAANAETFDATSFDVIDAAAIVHVIPENRADIAVQITAPGRVAAPRVQIDHSGRLVIDGNVRVTRCSGDWNGAGIDISGLGRVRRADLPVVTIRAPRELDFTAHGAVFADVGASSGGSMQFHGCGDATIANAQGDLDLLLRGSGDVIAQSVSGALVARLEGSGDLRAETAGSADVSLAGSGDLSVGAVRSGLAARLNGSGDLRVGAVQGGEVNLRLAGSGDLAVNGGAADVLDASLAGSGDLAFGGRAAVVRASLAGSGDIRVVSADRIETLRDNGSGEISIGH